MVSLASRTVFCLLLAAKAIFARALLTQRHSCFVTGDLATKCDRFHHTEITPVAVSVHQERADLCKV